MHAEILHGIDRSLAGASSAQEEVILLEHTRDCADCRRYRDNGVRAIGALKGFSFDVDAGLNRKVMASLARRAEEVEEQGRRRLRVWVGCLVAVLLTVSGSFAASDIGRLLTALFPIQAAQVHLGVLLFWIAPSLGFCLLFLLLAAMPAGGMNEKGLSL